MPFAPPLDGLFRAVRVAPALLDLVRHELHDSGALRQRRDAVAQLSQLVRAELWKRLNESLELPTAHDVATV